MAVHLKLREEVHPREYDNAVRATIQNHTITLYDAYSQEVASFPSDSVERWWIQTGGGYQLWKK
jgi:hypothetical protein